MRRGSPFARATAGLALALAAGVAQAQAAAAPAAAALPLAHAQTNAFVDGLLKAWYAPAARRFATDGEQLVERSQAWCAATPKNPARDPALDAARQAWVQAMVAWTRLSAVPLGPLLDRHSDTRLDFQPMRPAALDKAIAQPSRPGEWQMDRIGAQARGLPAMEYLLWKQPAAPRTPACAYLAALARDLRDEAQGLAQAFEAEANAPRSAAQAADWFNAYANQWLAGLSRMRWREIEMPVKSWGLDQAPRAASGQTALAWRERWQALRMMSTGGPGAPEGLMPLAGYLRARGLDAAAAATIRDTAAADAALATAGPTLPTASLLDAAKRVDTLGHVMSREVPERLQIQLEFSSDDGD